MSTLLVSTAVDTAGAPNWINLHCLFERLAFVGIIGGQLRATPYTSKYDSAVMIREVSVGCPQLGTYNCRENSFSDSCTPDRCWFFSLARS